LTRSFASPRWGGIVHPEQAIRLFRMETTAIRDIPGRSCISGEIHKGPA
jgi:hypothetical protein